MTINETHSIPQVLICNHRQSPKNKPRLNPIVEATLYPMDTITARSPRTPTEHLPRYRNLTTPTVWSESTVYATTVPIGNQLFIFSHLTNHKNKSRDLQFFSYNLTF